MMDITQKKNDNSVELIRPKGEGGIANTTDTKNPLNELESQAKHFHGIKEQKNSEVAFY